MPVHQLNESQKRILDLMKVTPEVKTENLQTVVKDMYKKKKRILDLTKKYPTPFYVLDVKALHQDIRSFKKTFTEHFPECQYYYAVKSNHYPYIIETVVAEGFGLDVSSGRELALALKTKCKNIVFSGPGKTDAELLIALKNQARVTVHIDSFSELRRLDALSKKEKKHISVGVRIYTPVHGNWSKFGIDIQDLTKFWNLASKATYINLRGIHFHCSWNRNPSKYVKIIEQLGTYLAKNFTQEMRKQIEFIDLGGGYFPDNVEGYYPWTIHYPDTLPLGHVIKVTNDYYSIKSDFKERYHILRSNPLADFARDIKAAVDRYFKPILSAQYYTEPGRIISTRSMHIVVKILDKKNDTNVITDGGVNIVGWEYGEHFYYPLLNLTHPSLTNEQQCTIYGPLCTPHDLWGYYCYAKKIDEGDVIVVPNQGAYRYVLSQSFIKDIPPVYLLD